ncbi:MAG: 2-vinyl bacteriochlorophyllide hydratase, partial [Tagaea sp.]
MSKNFAIDRVLGRFDFCPWGTLSGRAAERHGAARRRVPLYTPEERRRRDESRWTLVQGILA